MAKAAEFPGPVVRGPAGLDDDSDRGLLGEKPMKLLAVEPMPVDDATGAVGTGQFEHVLCEIDSDEGSIHDGLLLFFTR